MTFRIVSQRQLSEEEIQICREARTLLGRGIDRRELIKMMGLAGTVGAGLVMGIRPAHAFLPPLAVFALFTASQFVVQSAVAATFSLRNDQEQPVKGGVLLQLKEPSGRIEQRGSQYVDVEPYSEVTINHSEFEARTIGQNEYSAKTSVNQEDTRFEVIDTYSPM